MQGHRSFAGFSVGSNLRLFKFIHGYAINICHIEGVKQAFKLLTYINLIKYLMW